MKFFIDTANLDQIREANDLGVFWGGGEKKPEKGNVFGVGVFCGVV